jgi:hypothetical protein
MVATTAKTEAFAFGANTEKIDKHRMATITPANNLFIFLSPFFTF